ncbi:MAG: SIS domain-containing protein [Candidatus Glassbacteria bacterium]
MKTPFLEEVDRQPQALLELVKFYRDRGLGRLEEWQGLLERSDRLVFCSMGTSEIAPCLIRDRLAESGKTVVLDDAGERLHYLQEPVESDVLYVLISQSGESAETKKLAQRLAGRVTLVVLANDEASTMARLASLFLPLKAGAERSVSNQTYVNTLGLLYLMAGGRSEALERVAGWLSRPVDEERVAAAAAWLHPADSLHFIARGPALAAARQMALTFMEGAKSHATAFTGGAFRHGPFEVLGPGHRAVVLAPDGKTGELTSAMALEMAQRGSRVVLITDIEKTLGHENLLRLEVANFGEERLFPLAIAQVQNYLLYHVARLRGYEAGVFRIASKVTTTE